jgi:hypothetical protein
VGVAFQNYDGWDFQLSFVILEIYKLGETFDPIKLVPAIAVRRIGSPLSKK